MKKIAVCIISLGLGLGAGVPVALADGISVGISVNLAPPPLPVYAQPPLPGPGYIWTPGYWAWNAEWQDYYWVPGVWVMAPQPGLLWTPAWWGWDNGVYVFHAGYWGHHVGFYGGIDYGFGYVGRGYLGGHWDHGQFFYNKAANNITNVNVTNVYNKAVIDNRIDARGVSFNGGPGGVSAKPSAGELRAMQAHHLDFTADQRSHFEAARSRQDFRFSNNHGVPFIGGTSRFGEFENRDMTTRAFAPGTRFDNGGGFRHDGRRF